MPRRSKRRRCPSFKTGPSTPLEKKSRPRKRREKKDKVQEEATTPAINNVKATKQSNSSDLTLGVVASTQSPLTTDMMYMCDCGLLHTDIVVVKSAHNAHNTGCDLHNDVSPCRALPTFNPTTNAALKRRKKDNTVHLELSAFQWVTRWLTKNKAWPTVAYPWVQWATTYHPTSQFIWYEGSTPDQVSSRASNFAERFSRNRSGFDGILKSWWSKFAIVLLPLRNMAFKEVSAWVYY